MKILLLTTQNLTDGGSIFRHGRQVSLEWAEFRPLGT